MMSDEIKPALTAEEWRVLKEDYPGAFVPDGDPREYLMTGDFVLNAERHALAALCLHGQPFGFTREDVELLRETNENAVDCQDLADRIEALLPPETP